MLVSLRSGEEPRSMGRKTTENFFGKLDDKSVEISVTQRVAEDVADILGVAFFFSC